MPSSASWLGHHSHHRSELAVFAPYCPTCESRVLLSTRRIVGVAAARDVTLRCYCGTEVAWDAVAPTPEPAAPVQPAAEDRELVSI